MQRALQKGVKLNSLSAYYHDSPDDFAAHTFIINYSYLNTEHLAEAINVLYDCIKNRWKGLFCVPPSSTIYSRNLFAVTHHLKEVSVFSTEINYALFPV